MSCLQLQFLCIFYDLWPKTTYYDLW